ncbi:hypothetical protein CHLRE_02g118125v5 [Chlamydomonas reinhardtii]|uniref:Uncharacterized protein n=1 Tax=Chlamydomonas reinhardtii TaxID=3055 RepID=A0A2K3E3G2_CHLRE|nr:uncharacterized protein CHLRE_02g118125v5 [Chlamydomonas reinhardtii]PNW87328.1 hypothetical protein CHLRE_02g118125v5 [Chlamydomonas reinhardtii]
MRVEVPRAAAATAPTTTTAAVAVLEAGMLLAAGEMRSSRSLSDGMPQLRTSGMSTGCQPTFPGVALRGCGWWVTAVGGTTPCRGLTTPGCGSWRHWTRCGCSRTLVEVGDGTDQPLAEGIAVAWVQPTFPLGGTTILLDPSLQLGLSSPAVGPPPYGPLCLEHLHLQGLDLSSGELRTIAELLPGLQVLMLSTCYVPPAELPLLCGAERLHTLVLRMRDLDLCLQPHTAQEALQELCLRSPALEDLQLRPSFEDVVDEYLELDHEAHARWEDCGRAQVQEAVWRLTEAVKLQTDGRKLGPGDGGCGGQGQAAAEGRSRRLRPHVRVELLRPVAWWETDWKEVEYRGHE